MQQLPKDYANSKVILIVEENLELGDFMVEAIYQKTKHVPLLATTIERAVELLQCIHPDLLLLNYHLAGQKGLAFYDDFHANSQFSAIPAIIVDACQSKHVQEIHRRNLLSLTRPTNEYDLLVIIEQAVTHPQVFT